MGRQTTKEELVSRIREIRQAIPDIALRTTLISGFPGESEEQHKELLDFVEETRFDRLGVFPYSIEEDTPAAEFPNQIPEEVKQARRDEIMDEFTVSLYDELARIFQITPMTLPDAAITEIQEMSAAKYQSWDWTYGHSPRFEFRREFDFRGNKISISYKTVKGIIQEITLDPPDDRIRASLTGQRLKVEELRELFSRIPGYENFYKNIL